MKKLFQVLLVLGLMGQTVVASADMVVFWDDTVTDRSNLSAIVRNESGQIEVFFKVTPTLSTRALFFLCNDKYDEKKAKATVDVIFKTLEKDKNINPFDIFRKAGLTGCTRQ